MYHLIAICGPNSLNSRSIARFDFIQQRSEMFMNNSKSDWQSLE